MAHKVGQVRGRREQVAAGWRWHAKVDNILSGLALTEASVAEQLNAAEPTDDLDLPVAIPAFAELLERYQEQLPADAQVAERLAEAPTLAAQLQDAPGTVALAKAAAVADTAEIDYYDGRLYITMRELFTAGRAAIRHGDLQAQPAEYRFHRLAAWDRDRSTKPQAPPPIDPQ